MCRFTFLKVCLLASLSVVLAASACSKLTLPRLGFGEEEPQAPSVPLRVRVELDPSVSQAAIPYKDSCDSPQVLPVGDRLRQMLLVDTRKVFQEVIDREDPSLGIYADAVLRFTLEEQNLELYIPRHEADAEYPAKATLRLRMVLTEAPDGQEIFAGSVKGTGKWTVTTDEGGVDCEVEGVVIPVNDALDELSDQLVNRLRHSAEIQAASVRLLARRQVLASRLPQPTVPPQVPPVGADHRLPQGLSFRVLLEDQNRNRIFEGNEKITIQVEVTNQGPRVAQGVAVALSGTPALVQQFQSPVSVGVLQAGEHKQVTLAATLPPDISEQQSELVVQVIEASGLGLPSPKRFIAWVRPAGDAGDGVEVLSVDVDHIPAKVPGFERKNMYAVVVGIGTYRGDRSPSLPYAKRDAEVVAQYLQTVTGIPEPNVRVLTDEYAVLSDLREAFEGWLTRRAAKDSIVLIYVVGKGLARKNSGEVYLLPYEARSASRYRVYPLAHIVKTLDRLPSKSAVLFFDLSFSNKAGAPPRKLAWLDAKASGKNRAVIIASSDVAVPSVQFERGQHGLFTYHVLKGLQGSADKDKNGSISVGELFGYLKTRLHEAVRAEGEQAPTAVMIPHLPAGSRLGTLPIGNVKKSS
ncbi:caspase family protein [Nitrospiraceae bacterium AH_259_D15_M11_P09]|nr:caspase family protein [Nitrospiraceae bacterium AH_259_D15_M11_P09]